MPHNITDAERERIEKFATTPKYKRSPELLEPGTGDEDE